MYKKLNNNIKMERTSFSKTANGKICFVLRSNQFETCVAIKMYNGKSIIATIGNKINKKALLEHLPKVYVKNNNAIILW